MPRLLILLLPNDELFLVVEGVLVFGHDHVGHGLSEGERVQVLCKLFSGKECSRKIVFFLIHYNPFLAYKLLFFKAPSGRPIWQISLRPIAAQSLRGRGGKIVKTFGKNTIFPEHPVYENY